MRDKVVCDNVIFERDGLTCSVDVTKCYACQAKETSMSPSATPATPATQNDGRCHQVPRLPRKVARRHKRPTGTKRVARSSSVPQRLPRRTKVDLSKCHACPAKCRGVTGDQRGPSTPPDPAQCNKGHACHAKCRSMLPSAMPVCDKVVCVCEPSEDVKLLTFFCL